MSSTPLTDEPKAAAAAATGLTRQEKMMAFGNLGSFLLTVAFNALGSTGAISGYQIGEISDYYYTKITPAASAFSIWGLIYFGVALFVLLPFLPNFLAPSKQTVLRETGYLFMLSNAFNSLWILTFMWRTAATTWISSPLLFGLLVTLQLMLKKPFLAAPPATTSWVESFAQSFTFSVYAGWATVAYIVNVSAALVSTGWSDGAPWTAEGWCILMLVIAAVVNILMIFREHNPVHALVYSWAAYWISMAQKGVSDNVALGALVLAIIIAVLAVGKLGHQIYTKYASAKGQPAQGEPVPAEV